MIDDDGTIIHFYPWDADTMALDNLPCMGGEQAREQVYDWLLSDRGFEPGGDPDLPHWLRRRGVVCEVSEGLRTELVSDLYGFAPKTSIFFRLEKGDTHLAGWDAVRSTVLAAIDRFACDVVLFGPDDGTMLAARDGELRLARGAWGPRDLDAMDRPYVLTALE